MTVRELIDSHRVTEKTATISVHGMTFIVKVPQGIGDIFTLRKRAEELTKAVHDGAPADWQPFLPTTDDVLRIVATLKTALIEPKATTLQLLEMAFTCGATILELYAAYTNAVGAIYAAAGIQAPGDPLHDAEQIDWDDTETPQQDTAPGEPIASDGASQNQGE